jgi:hypothetical protein
MKTTIKAALFIAAISLSVNSCSHKTRQVTQDVKEVADTVGNKTAEIAAKGVAQATDKIYEGKVGPDGQTIYIDKNSKYFYIDNKGHRVFLTKDKLKDKSE